MTFLYENLITALLPSHPFMLVHNSTSSEVQVFFYITCFNQDKSLFLLFKTNYITNSNGKFWQVVKIHQTSTCRNATKTSATQEYGRKQFKVNKKDIKTNLDFICLLEIIFCSTFLVSVLLLQTILLQQIFENTYLCFLTPRLIIKTQSKEIYKNNTSFISLIFSMNCSICDLIYHEALVFI